MKKNKKIWHNIKGNTTPQLAFSKTMGGNGRQTEAKTDRLLGGQSHAGPGWPKAPLSGIGAGRR